MSRKEFWYQVFVEVLRKNGAEGNVATAVKEADLALEAFESIDKIGA